MMDLSHFTARPHAIIVAIVRKHLLCEFLQRNFYFYLLSVHVHFAKLKFLGEKGHFLYQDAHFVAAGIMA